MNGDSLAMFNVFEISLLFAIDFETIREAFVLTKSKLFALLDEFCLLWGYPSASSWASCSTQISFWFSLMYCIVSSQIVSSFVSVATVLETCSGSSSISLHHGFGQFLHLPGAMSARLAIRTPWGLRWTFLGFRSRQIFRHLWRVSINPSTRFPVFPLLCSQRTLVVPCALLAATVVPSISRSNDRFCQFWHVHWVSAF